MKSKKLVIAIDGPAGAGKSTIAKMVAEKLCYIYIDTGAMYRAVTYKFLQSGLPFDEELAGKLAEDINICFKPEDGLNRVFVDGEEVTEEIRSQAVTTNVSKVSAVAAVRTAMVGQQRKMGKKGGVVLDGRDIGTVVFPDANVKIFLTADVEERVNRRYKELLGKNQTVDEQKLRDEIIARDKYDSEREISPLRCAEDAFFLDTSEMDIPEVVNKILEICKVN
ncbi:MAG: (d)CMP kinase [Negativicutes bacterium]|nr:(d)CMP kinase [Negativicutes bacterium]